MTGSVRTWGLIGRGRLLGGQTVSIPMVVEGPEREAAKELFRWWMSAHLKADDIVIETFDTTGSEPMGSLFYRDPIEDYLES